MPDRLSDKTESDDAVSSDFESRVLVLAEDATGLPNIDNSTHGVWLDANVEDEAFAEDGTPPHIDGHPEADIEDFFDDNVPSNLPDVATCEASDESRFMSLIESTDIPADFTVTEFGVTVAIADKNGNLRHDHAFGPLLVTARLRHASKGTFGREIVYLDQNHRLRTGVVWDNDLHSSNATLAGNLASQGLWIATGSRSRAQLVHYLNECTPQASKVFVDRSGWMDRDTFVLGPRAIGRHDVMVANNPIFEGASLTGTLDEWTQKIGLKCSDNHFLLFGICLALSGPVFKMTGDQAFGIHFYGESSTGKTTLARAAASVFGPGHTGTGGFMQSWRATGNALEYCLAARNDTLLVLDEITEATPDTVSEVSYMGANGSGKIRANAQGSIAPALEWRVPILSTGEESIPDYISKGRREIHSGQNIRLLSVPISSELHETGPFRNLHEFVDAAELSRSIERASGAHAGHLGRVFIEALCASYDSRVDEITSVIRLFENRFINSSLNPFEKRVLRFFGVVAASGALASKLNLLPQDRDEVFSAVTSVFDSWREHNAGRISVSDNLLLTLQAVLERHGNSRFVSTSRDFVYVPSDDIWGVWDDDNRYCWFTSNAFERVVLEGKDNRSSYAALIRAGIVISDGTTSTTWRKRYPRYFRTPQVRCLKIDVAKLHEILGICEDTIDIKDPGASNAAQPRRTLDDIRNLRERSRTA